MYWFPNIAMFVSNRLGMTNLRESLNFTEYFSVSGSTSKLECVVSIIVRMEIKLKSDFMRMNPWLRTADGESRRLSFELNQSPLSLLKLMWLQTAKAHHSHYWKVTEFSRIYPFSQMQASAFEEVRYTLQVKTELCSVENLHMVKG